MNINNRIIYIYDSFKDYITALSVFKVGNITFLTKLLFLFLRCDKLAIVNHFQSLFLLEYRFLH